MIYTLWLLCLGLLASCARAGESAPPQTVAQAVLELNRIIAGLLKLDVDLSEPPEDLGPAIKARFPAGYDRSELNALLSSLRQFKHEKCVIKIMDDKEKVLVDIMYKHRRKDGTLGAVGAYIGFRFDASGRGKTASFTEYGIAADLAR